MRSIASFIALSLSLAPALAIPTLNARAQDILYNDGTKGTVDGQASDFGADFHASGFLRRGSCSTTVQIAECYTGDLAADPTKMLETSDKKPYIVGGVGTNQRTLLQGPIYFNATAPVVTHTVRIHISTAFTTIAAGSDKAVTLVGLRNFNSAKGISSLDVRARTFVGEETSGTVLYVAVPLPNGQEQFPEEFDLSDAVGKTIDITYTLGINGATVDKDKSLVAVVSGKFTSGGGKLFETGVTKSSYPKGVVDASNHRIIFGADRKASAGQQELKLWFGDYSVTPAGPQSPE